MADSTHNPLPEPRARRLAVAGIVAALAALFTALFARARLATRSALVTDEPEKPIVGARHVVPLPANVKPASPRRTFAFIILTILVAVVLIALQNDASPLAVPVFVAVMVGALILAVASAPARVRRIILTPVLAVGVMYRYTHALWKSLIAILVFYRFRIAALTACGSLGLMVLSSHAFQIARMDRSPIDEPVKYMLAGGIVLGISIFFARPNLALPALPALQIGVLAHVNTWVTGMGIAVLLFLSEINGKATGTQRLYPIDTDAQFWLLVLGISLVVMGLSGWQPVLRLPPLKWRALLLGMLLVIIANLTSYIISFGVFLAWANAIINAIAFVVVRLGDALILWAFIPPQVKLPHPTLQFNRRNIILVAAALIALYFLASLSGTILLDLAFALAVNQSFWVFMAAANFIRIPIAALYRRLTADPPLDSERTQHSALTTQHFLSRITHYSLLITIFLVAIFARFYLLNDTMRFLVDEESFIGATHYLRAVPNMEILAPFSSIAAFPYMYPYLQRHTIDVFGHTLGGLRAASAIMGVLGVVALYFLARTLFDRKTALLAALFLAVLPVHIQFSRIGISEIASPFFGTLAFAFIGRGLLHDRRTDFAIGGALLGLTHYFHEGGRLLYTPLALAWVAACLLFTVRSKILNSPRSEGEAAAGVGVRVFLPQPSALSTRNWFVAFAALIIVAAPIYYTLIAIHRPIFARMVDNNSGLGASYWRNLSVPTNLDSHIRYHLLPAFQVYVNQVDNTLFYADDNAFILPALVPLFLLGVFYAAWRWRAPGMLLLLMWLLSTSLGNSLMVDSAGSPRYVMVFPALALACAVGLRYTVPLVIRHVLRARVLIAVAAVGLAFVQVNYYFNDHLPAYNTVFRAAKASPDGYDAAFRSADFPVGTNIHIISKNLFSQIEAVGLLGLMRNNLNLDTVTPDDVTGEYIGELPCRVDHAFFIERTDFRTLGKLRTYFFLRDAQFTPYDDFSPRQRLILFYAPYLKGTEKAYDRKC